MADGQAGRGAGRSRLRSQARQHGRQIMGFSQQDSRLEDSGDSAVRRQLERSAGRQTQEEVGVQTKRLEQVEEVRFLKVDQDGCINESVPPAVAGGSLLRL